MDKDTQWKIELKYSYAAGARQLEPVSTKLCVIETAAAAALCEHQHQLAATILNSLISGITLSGGGMKYRVRAQLLRPTEILFEARSKGLRPHVDVHQQHHHDHSQMWIPNHQQWSRLRFHPADQWTESISVMHCDGARCVCVCVYCKDNQRQWAMKTPAQARSSVFSSKLSSASDQKTIIHLLHPAPKKCISRKRMKCCCPNFFHCYR